MNDLLFGVSIEEIERITGESQKVIKKWKNGTKQVPEPALRLLKLYVTGDASILLGDERKGYRFSNNLIFVPGFLLTGCATQNSHQSNRLEHQELKMYILDHREVNQKQKKPLIIHLRLIPRTVKI